MKNKDWHNLPDEEIFAEFATNRNRGLTNDLVKEYREIFGANILGNNSGLNIGSRLRQIVSRPLFYALVIMGIIALCFRCYIDAAAIFGILAPNLFVCFFLPGKTLKAFKKLSLSLNTSVHVIRKNNVLVINAAELVPGDIVIVRAGEKIPADLRLIQVNDFCTDESSLTGNSSPVDKYTHLLAPNTALSGRSNMAFASTLVLSGQAKGVVVATGKNSEIGKISQMINTAQDLKTPLAEKIEQYGIHLLWLIVLLTGIILAAGWLHEKALSEAIPSAITLAAAVIPAGLPIAAAILLAASVNRIARKHIIVKNLPALETLGNADVICLDKNSLTENKMTVQKISSGDFDYEISGLGYDFDGTYSPDNANIALMQCLKTGVFCSDANFCEIDGGFYPEGNPTELALLVSAAKKNLFFSGLREANQVLSRIPFASDYQYMAVLCQDQTIYVKGAVEAILPYCTQIMLADGSLKDIDKETVLEKSAQYASQGMRVLGFAIKQNFDRETIEHRDIQRNLIFVGLQAMIDPPHPDAAETVAACRQAGISVKMITDDNLVTARAVAAQMNIIGSETESRIMDGAELAQTCDNYLRETVEETDVFAQINSEDRLRLVKSLQNNGHIVALMGNGVNDMPALKQANAGIAMGIRGTDVARETADIILADDNIVSLTSAIKAGRTVFGNLIKCIQLMLPVCLAETLIIMMSAVFGTGIPFTAAQILWINMITAVLLGTVIPFLPVGKAHQIKSKTSSVHSKSLR